MSFPHRLIFQNTFRLQRPAYSLFGQCRTVHASPRSLFRQALTTNLSGLPITCVKSSSFVSFRSSLGTKLKQTFSRNIRDYYSSRRPNGTWTQIRIRLNRIPGPYIVYTIIGINVLVWGAWQVAESALQLRDPKPLKWLYENMTLSWGNLREGRIWTLLTSSISHSNSSHLLMNCLGLWMFCPPVASSLGAAAFLTVYAASAVGCDLFSIWWNWGRNYRSLGASGALCGIMSFTACLAPTTSVALYGIIPLPLWGVVAGVFLYDLWGARTGRGNVDFAGHLGGTFTGVALYFLRRRLGIRGLY